LEKNDFYGFPSSNLSFIYGISNFDENEMKRTHLFKP
jgi:hypothetical protein